MAEIVGGFMVPHVPPIPRGDFGETPEQKAASDKAFEGIAARLEELSADTVIIVGDDHYENFGPHCIPSCLIATGDVGISAHAQTLGMEGEPIPNNEALANHILESGYRDGIDWSFAKTLDVDHSVAIPYYMTVKRYPHMNIIPVYLNCVVEPFIATRRAYEVGKSIGRAVASWSGNERVVVFGTGGLSHWVGGPGMGEINEEFDQRILEMVAKRDMDGLLALDDAEILAQAGNGALEIKNWICALGALPETQGEIIAYEPIPTWVTGCGFVELKVAA